MHMNHRRKVKSNYAYGRREMSRVEAGGYREKSGLPEGYAYKRKRQEPLPVPDPLPFPVEEGLLPILYLHYQV